MSAVIWCGIVAVWAFLLIPTWVRRGDLHWRRSSVAAAGPKAGARASRIVRSGPAVVSRSVAMTRSVAATRATRVSQASSRPKARLREVRASHAGALRYRAPKSAGRRPLHVRRGHRLATLLLLVIVSAALAMVTGTLGVAAQVVCDLALLAYIVHLRRAARERSRELARERRAMVARRAYERRLAATRGRREVTGWGAAPSSTHRPALDPTSQLDLDETRAIELTDSAKEYADVETEEMLVARTG